MKIITTHDGSSTISLVDGLEHYHSVHGAVTESRHIFIQAGLNYPLPESGELRIFEMGFGTGLNALLTLIENDSKKNIHYDTIELFPLEDHLVNEMNYPEILGRADLRTVFESLHKSPWNKRCKITDKFNLLKLCGNILLIQLPVEKFHLVYFDAFAPWFSPECWTIEVFEKVYKAMVPGGVLVTYSSKGEVKRALKTAGFIVEKLPGPAGKREFVRARKQENPC